MNLNKLMKQAQKMQEKMTQAQAELAEKTVEVQAAGGKITVVANGAGDVISIKIAKEIVDPEDVEFLEDAVLSGIKQAIEQGKAIASSEMSKITGGMSVRNECGGAGTVGTRTLSLCAQRGSTPLRCYSDPPRQGESADKMSARRTGQRPVFHSYNRCAMRRCSSYTHTSQMPNALIFSARRS